MSTISNPTQIQSTFTPALQEAADTKTSSAASQIASTTVSETPSEQEIESVDTEALEKKIAAKEEKLGLQKAEEVLDKFLREMPPRPSRWHPFDRHKYDKNMAHLSAQVDKCKAAAANCNTAASALSKKSLTELVQEARSEVAKTTKLEDNTFGKYFNAQVEFQKEMRTLLGEIGTQDNTDLLLMLNKSEFRLTETVNMYDDITTYTDADAKELDITDGLIFYDEKLISNKVANDQISQYSKDFLDKITDAVKNAKPEEMTALLGNLNDLVATLENDLAVLKGEKFREAKNATPVMQAFTLDSENIAELRTEMQSRLETLSALKEQLSPEKAFLQILKNSLPEIPQDKLATIASDADKTKIAQDYTALRTELLAQIESGTLNTENMGSSVEENSFMQKMNKALNSLEIIDETLVKVPSSELEKTLSEIKNTKLGFEDYIQKAYEGKDLDPVTILEAKLRGIAVDDILNTGHIIVEETGKKSNGQVNVVRFIKASDDNGIMQDIVFKPELGAQAGMAKIYGHLSTANVTKVNIASVNVAEQIGCGSIMPKSKFACIDGIPGLAMEKAKGSILLDIKSNKKVLEFNGEKVNFTEMLGKLKEKSPDLPKKMLTNLTQELCKLEWADILSGQVDRHSQNLLIDINQEGEVQVTGIDNDFAFDVIRTGVLRFDFSNMAGSVPEFNGVKDRQIELKDPFGIMPATDSQLEFNHINRTIEGLNKSITYDVTGTLAATAMKLPSHIPLDVYNKLTQLSSADYRASIEPLLPKQAVDVAVMRFEDAQRFAKAYKEKGLVVDDFSKLDFSKFKNQVLTGFDEKRFLTNNFQEHFLSSTSSTKPALLSINELI